MVETKHRTFMHDNKLEITDFSKPVQDKVRIFNRMQDKLDQTVGEDHTRLKGRLLSLDREICTDMLDEIEDRLENNEMVEVSSDEEILEELWKMKRTEGLNRSDLEKYGIKTKISGRRIQIGKYILHRRLTGFYYVYDLGKVSA